jgi:16S rRNA (guanine527-N7)-methyltransferase
MVVATFGEPITLVEPRRLRVEFLERVKTELSLDNVRIVFGKAEQLAGTFDIITARAVAALPSLLAMTTHLAHYGTKWVLPKGQKAKSELDEARRSWQGRFELMPSLTSPDASIVIAEGVQPRGKR